MGTTRCGKIIATLMLLATIMAFVPPDSGSAPAEPPRVAEIELVEGFYDSGAFQLGLETVGVMLARGNQFEPNLHRDALILAARCQVQLGRYVLAQALFQDVLALDSSWSPEPGQMPAAEIAVYERAAATRQQDQDGRWWQKIYVIGPVAAAAAGVVLAAVGGGGSDDAPQTGSQPLGEPPGPPVGR